MKNNIFAIAVLALCLITMPSWAMNDDDDNNNDSHRSVESYKSENEIATVEGISDVATMDGTDEWSSSASTESDDGRIFFVHIPNASASVLYRDIVENHQFSIRHWRREKARSGTLEENQKIFDSYQLGEELCVVLRRAIKKFRATQTLMCIGNGSRLSYGLIIQLNTAKEQPVEMVKKYCQKSRYVYQVLANKDALRQYLGTPSHIPLSAVLTVVKPVE